MAYNKDNDVTAGYISPEHAKMLLRLRIDGKRTKRAQLEFLIEREYAKVAGVGEPL